MDFISQIPTLCNIKFTPVLAEAGMKLSAQPLLLPDDYHTLPEDKEPFKEHIKSWQTPKDYAQPVQLNDVQYIELHREGQNDCWFWIYDCDGNKITPSQELANCKVNNSGSIYIKDDGTEIPLTVNKWYFRFSDYTLTPGRYFIILPVEFYDGITLLDTKYWLSEPLDVKAAHEDTIYIECWNETNRMDVLFNLSGNADGQFFTPRFGHRVSGCIIDAPIPKSSDVYFKEQDFEQREITSTPWNVKKLLIGGNDGVPPYIIEKLNWALSCDNIYIDGRRYVKNDGGELQIDGADYYPLYEAEIEIREYDRQDMFTDAGRGVLIEIYEEPDLPYYVRLIQFNGVDLLGGYGWDIRLTATRDDLVIYLNGAINDANNFKGEWIFDSGVLYYQAGIGENITSICDILIKYVDIDITIPNDGDTFSVSLQGGTVGLSWGDGIANSVVPNSGAYTLYTHTYETAGNYTLRMYHGDDVLRIALANTSAGDGYATDISGDASAVLERFDCRDTDMSGLASGIDLHFLAPARYTIEQIVFYNCQLSGLDGTVFADYSAQGSYANGLQWKNINTYALGENNMSSAEVTAALVDFYEHTKHNSIGLITLQQTPAAPLSSPATTYKINLIAQGWTVISN